MKRDLYGAIIILCILPSLIIAGTTGKIAGFVTDEASGEPLPGVNVLIEGTSLGAATDLDGYYVILNVPPGEFKVQAMMIGYATNTLVQVRVMIDQTTTLNMVMSEETLETETIEIVAKRPVVEKDVAASTVNLRFEEIEALPVTTVRGIVALQAGVEGFSIRGGGSDELAFMVDGITLRDERDNRPYAGISYTSIDEIQVQTGGFNAEFGNIRSGVINIVTKEGNRNKYDFSLIGRYKFAAPKHFGHSPNSPESFWIKPYIDDAVCWTGTANGAWDQHTQRQFPKFEGWNKISEKLLLDDESTNDLTPQAAQQLFLWEHRRQLDINGPDYDLDMSFGGPVPFISEDLGNLRFHTSYRRAQDMYIIPVSDDAYRDYNWQLKITSDIGENQKLLITGLIGRETGSADNNSGNPGIFKYTYEIPSYIDLGWSYHDGAIYGTDYWALSAVDYTSLGIKFTHALSPTTFYEAQLHRMSSSYDVNPGPARDSRNLYRFGESYFVDEAPFGFEASSPASSLTGMNMGTGFATSRDSSKVATYSAKFDIASQLDRYNFVKAGAEFVLSHTEVNYARYDATLKASNQQTKWDKTPVRAAMYIQDKLEFEGMIAQLGLRLDYSHAGGDWYEYDPYNQAFTSAYSAGIDTLLNKEPTKHIFTLSPRLAISFPITENSKLYFNYGHFRQLPTPENLYLLRKSGFDNHVNRIASPNNPLPKTVAYELGYEHNLFDQFLIRTAGYYKDLSDQPRTVQFISEDAAVNYYVSEPNSYEDIRGFEITLNKNRGAWGRGFINYTYMVSTYGYFGYGKYFQSSVDQRKYERETNYHYQTKPRPRPYARANIDVFTPLDFGPEVAGFKPLENMRLNILASWKAGTYETWAGGGALPGLQYNVQWRDNYYCDIRLAKNMRIAGVNLELFVDIDNVFNIKLMRNYGFWPALDKNDYMKSLHLPSNTEGIEQFGYVNIPGDDRPGDYRRPGVDFVPIVAVNNRTSVRIPNEKDLYYEATTKSYLRYRDGSWVHEDKSRVNRILDEKAYIDMPNLQYFTFLNPRSVFWGIKLSFDL
jgi:hypothetical protein